MAEARHPRLLTVLVALLLLVLVGCGGEDQPAGRLHGTSVDPPFEVADVELTDTEGQPFSLAEDLDNRLTLLFFGYTNCPTECPLVMSTVTSALTRLDDADREQVDFVFVTTDPSRDTRPVLRRYLDRIDPSYVGLTGDLQDVGRLAKSVGIFVADAEMLASGGYDLGSHGTQVLGVQPDGQVPVYWDMETSSAEYAADITRLLS